MAEAKCRVRAHCAIHDKARTVAAGRAGVARVFAQHVEHVAKVEPDRPHTQLHFAVEEWRCKVGLHLNMQVAQRAPREEYQAHVTSIEVWCVC